MTEKMQEMGPTVYRPYPRRLEVHPVTDVIAKETLSPQLILNTLSVGPARARTLDLPHDRLVPIQLSKPGGGNTFAL